MLGLSKELKTKYFSAVNCLLDDKINQWLSENDVEVVNININSRFEALLVYRPIKERKVTSTTSERLKELRRL